MRHTVLVLLAATVSYGQIAPAPGTAPKGPGAQPPAARIAILAPAMPSNEIDQAFKRLYNYDFRGAHAQVDVRIADHPDEPFPYAVRASIYLFQELDRLSILEGEFFADDKRIAEKKKLRADDDLRRRLFRAIADSESRAGTALAANPDDRLALYATVVTQGVATDYAALVEKRQIASLSTARLSQERANRLLKLDPKFYDAYLTTGFSEYLLGSMPFFLRWFVHFDGVEGSKDKAVEHMTLVATEGRYLRPFAKVLLAIAHLREKRPRDAERLLDELAREFPQNPLFRKELERVRALR